MWACVPSEGQLVEQSGGEDALRGLSIARTNQLSHGLTAEAVGVDDLEHAAVLNPMAVLVVDEEDDAGGTELLCEVAQVHERTLREEGEVRVTEPHEEAVRRLVVDAGKLVQGLGAAQAGAGVDHELAVSGDLQSRNQRSQRSAKLLCSKNAG